MILRMRMPVYHHLEKIKVTLAGFDMLPQSVRVKKRKKKIQATTYPQNLYFN